MNFEDIIYAQKEKLPDWVKEKFQECLLAIDIDGTLLEHGKPFSVQMKKSIKKIANSGIIFCIATGRGILSLKIILKELGINKCHAVCSNGAVVASFDPSYENGYKILWQKEFIPKNIIQTLEKNFERPYYALEETENGYYVNEIFPKNTIFGKQIKITDYSIIEKPTRRLLVSLPGLSQNEIIKKLKNIDCSEVECTLGQISWLDITAKNINKKLGLEKIIDMLSLNKEYTIAVGDGDNDKKMFQLVAHAVAMGNASEDVKKYANAITGTVYEDGCAALFEAIIQTLYK